MALTAVDHVGEDGAVSETLEDKFYGLDKRLEVGFAEINARLDVMALSQDAGWARLNDRVTEADRRVGGLIGAVKAVRLRVDEMPRPDTLNETVDLARGTSSRLDRLIYFMLGSGLLGGGLGAAFAAAFGAG